MNIDTVLSKLDAKIKNLELINIELNKIDTLVNLYEINKNIAIIIALTDTKLDVLQYCK